MKILLKLSILKVDIRSFFGRIFGIGWYQFFLYRSFTNTYLHILIKITQWHWVVTIFLQNRTTDFDETLHVAWVCPGEGFGTIGTSGYSPV